MFYTREWKCTDPLDKGCECTIVWSYEDLADNGGPICPCCDSDMELMEESNEQNTH